MLKYASFFLNLETNVILQFFLGASAGTGAPRNTHKIRTECGCENGYKNHESFGSLLIIKWNKYPKWWILARRTYCLAINRGKFNAWAEKVWVKVKECHENIICHSKQIIQLDLLWIFNNSNSFFDIQFSKYFGGIACHPTYFSDW